MTGYDKVAIGNEIRRRRQLLGYTQEKVAEMIERSLPFYVRIELGQAGMSVDTMLAICEALKTDPTVLLLGRAISDEACANREWIAAAIANCPPDKQRFALDILKSYLKAIQAEIPSSPED